MKHFISLTVAALLAACAVTPPKGEFVAVQQVAAETQGKPYECVEYDPATDSCEGLSRWTIKGNTVTAVTEVALMADEPLRISMTTRHTIENGKVCGLIGTPKVRLNGAAYKHGENLLVDILTGVTTGLMSEICGTYYRSGEGYYAEASGPDGKVIREFSGTSRFFAEKKTLRAAPLE